MRVINREWLSRWATADVRTLSDEGAWRVADQWGPAACWCLRPELLEKAARVALRRRQNAHANRLVTRPSLPQSPGSCCILFAVRDRNAYPALRDCFLLPLRWVPGAESEGRLPPGLRSLADDVRRLLPARQPGQVPWSEWRLQLHAEAGLGDYDLSGFEDLQCDSGGVPLAAGLLLAGERGVPATDVWATGSLNEQGRVTRIDLLQVKVAEAVEQKARYLFVPSSQAEDARQIVQQLGATRGGDGLEIGELSESASTWKDAVGEYLARLDLPPLDQRFEPKRDWYQRQRDYRRGGDRNPQLQEYYQTELLEAIIQRARARLTDGADTHRPPVTRLVTIASGQGRQLIPLTAGVIDATHVLILHTPNFLEAAQAARDQLQQRASRLAVPCEVHCAVFEGNAEPPGDGQTKSDRPTLAAIGAEFRAAIERHWPGADPRGIILDATPGTKEMSLAMVLDVARPGNRIFCLRQNWQDRWWTPGDERPIIFPAPELA